MKNVYDYFVEQLNDNDLGLNYRGNFLFQFHTDKLEVYNQITGTLVSEVKDYSPVSLITSESVPFVESNERIDWLLEFGIIIPIKGQEFSETDDLDYANISRVCRAMNGLNITNGGSKFAFKVTKYPKYNGWSFLGKSKRAFLTVTINMAEIVKGNFTNDLTITVGSKVLDYTNASISSTKRFYTANNKSEDTNDYNKPVGRATVLEVTFNYDTETDILNEVMGKSDIKKQYNVSIDFADVEEPYTYNMVIESAPISLTKNTVMQITARFVEV